MSYDLLRIIANVSLGNNPTGPAAAFPRWNDPDPTAVRVQSILYSSLAASLLAASQSSSTTEDERHGYRAFRSRHGMPPLVLQAALLLLGYALSNHHFFISKVVASVLIGFTSFGLLFYLLIISAATLSYNCPFQTPPSLVLRFLIRFDNDHRRYLETTGKRLKRLFSQKKKRWPRPKSVGGPWSLPRFGAFEGGSGINHAELAMANTSEAPVPLFDKETDQRGFVLDSNCIAWMFQMSMDTDVIMAIMRFIPEVVWHAGIRTIPLEWLYDTVLECFDRSNGRPVAIPKLRNKAYPNAKALLHLAIQHPA